jgi:hypothetical protein
MMNVASRRVLPVVARKATAGGGRSLSALVEITEEYPG